MTLKAVPVDFEAKWKNLGTVCQNVIRCNDVSNDLWCRSFSDVYSLCVSRPDSQAFKLYEAVTEILRERITEILSDLSTTNDDDFLLNYARHWDNFHTGLKCLDNLFRFVNSQYVAPRRPCEADMLYGDPLPGAQTHTMEILQLGLSLWKTILIDSLKSRFTSCLLTEVSNDRLGITSHQDCISPCLESFLRVDELKGLTKIALNVYADLFDKPLIEKTRLCYSECTTRSRTLPCTDFILEALEFLKQETERASKYYPYSREEIINLFNEIFVLQQLDYLNSCIGEFVRTEQKDVLGKFYQLLAPTNQCTELIKQFGLLVKSKVNSVLLSIPNDRTAPSYFVNNLLAVRNYFTQFIDQVFDGTSTYRNEMDKVFEQAINCSSPYACEPSVRKSVAGSLSYRAPSTPVASSSAKPCSSDQSSNSVRVAQYVNRYMDELLRRSEQHPIDEELEEKISASIVLFKYIEEKDLFRQFYQKSLSYRLLFNPTTTLELEESTIAKLREVCGYEFVSKFHRMYSDIQVAQNMNENFRKYLITSNIVLPFSHHCNVLTVSAWPINSKATINFNLPPSLADYLAQFEAFYKQEFSGRNLHWVLASCMAESKLHYTDDGRQYSVHLTALHAATFTLFQSRKVDQMSLGALRLNLLGESVVEDSEADEILKKAVKPLVDAGFLKLLTPDDLSPTEEFKDSMIVALNRAYTNRHSKVKFLYNPALLLNSTATAGSKDEVEQVEKQVHEDRKFFIQAAIVRILKARKTISHAELLKCVIEEAKERFKPPVLLVKRCVEDLIEKGYLERNPNDADQYNYLA
nr:Cullin 2 [Hymenolepis microstoma]